MTVRTQIALESEAHRRAKRRATDLGISLAEYIRRLVAADLEGPESPEGELTSVFDLGDGGSTDIARDKHRLIAEAVERDSVSSKASEALGRR